MDITLGFSGMMALTRSTRSDFICLMRSTHEYGHYLAIDGAALIPMAKNLEIEKIFAKAVRPFRIISVLL
jgi:hypothetical protein